MRKNNVKRSFWDADLIILPWWNWWVMPLSSFISLQVIPIIQQLSTAPYFAVMLIGKKICMRKWRWVTRFSWRKAEAKGKCRQNSSKGRNEWAFFLKSNQNNPVLLTNTHCLNKPAQLPMTHFMFPKVAWLVGLEYFACVLRSSCESHAFIESLSTMIHFFG